MGQLRSKVWRNDQRHEALSPETYHGYILTIAVIDPHGKLLYDRSGETASQRGDTTNLQRLLDATK